MPFSPSNDFVPISQYVKSPFVFIVDPKLPVHSLADFVNLGRVKADDEAELFGLTPLALKLCRSTNGVSRKHGEVSRELWLEAFPGRTVEEVPITSVTNGVHAPTWVAPLVRDLYERYIAEDWDARACDEEVWSRGVARLPD